MSSKINFLDHTTQRSEESVAYTVDTTSAATSPTVSTVTIFATSNFASDLSGTNLSGAASVSGNVITTPLVTALTDGVRYRVYVTYTASGNTFVDYFEITCEDDE